jgi:DNA repair protein RadD
MYKLRAYQQEAVLKTIEHFRGSIDPAVIVLPTGAGKSLVIAELTRIARGRALVLTHVKELVEQNHEKLISLGRKAGIYSAGLKQANLSEQITFASIQSLSRHLDEIETPYSIVIVDECHRIGLDDNSQYLTTLKHLTSLNPDIKILGLTATPYRLGIGWIYHEHYRGMIRGEPERLFKKCIYELPLRYLIKEGFLTEPKVIDPAVEHYDFSSLTSPDGQFEQKPMNALLKGCKRVTKAIVKHITDVVSEHQRQGVMIFAATVEHAKEIIGYLPEDKTVLITGDTEHNDRDRFIRAFKEKQLTYLVNVSVLTTGFDAPHVDCIAILRPTESVSLYQQIIGRGLRTSPGKEDCLIIDYAGNRYDLYQPEVGEPKPDSDSVPVQVFCPECQFANTFWGKVDADGDLIEHFGRRCKGMVGEAPNAYQCTFRFQFKSCPFCGEENDIAARKCHSCNEVLVDPDEQLKKALELKNARVFRCAGMSFENQKNSLSVIYHDEDGESIKEKFNWDFASHQAAFYRVFGKRLKDGTLLPKIQSADQLLRYESRLKAPDFVVALEEKRYWKVHARIFDYQGRYRKAHQLG